MKHMLIKNLNLKYCFGVFPKILAHWPKLSKIK